MNGCIELDEELCGEGQCNLQITWQNVADYSSESVESDADSGPEKLVG